MWKLFRNGLAYNKVLFIVLYSVFIPLMVLNAVFGGREGALAKLMLFSVGFIGMIAGTEEIKYKFNRMEVSLPIPLRRIALNRFPLIVSYWLSLILMLLFSHMISRGGTIEMKFLWHTCALTGLLFAFVSLMGINFDLAFFFFRKMTTLILRGVAVLTASIAAFIFIFMTEFGERGKDPFPARISFTPILALGVLALGIILIFLSICVYMRRKSFVE